MLVLAAIDLLEGRCVRLLRGDFSAVTPYSDDPLATALDLERGGAPALHVVDLSGARAGRPVHATLVAEIARAAGVPIQAGGGVRRLEDIDSLLAAGVERVVLGTAALQDAPWLEQALCRFGAERLVVALDVRDERIFVSGWTAELVLGLDAALEDLARVGVTTLLVTDIARDGTLAGPNTDLYRRMSSRPFRIIAAGGIRTKTHLRELAEAGVYAAVVGRALYEGSLTLEDMRQVSCS